MMERGLSFAALAVVFPCMVALPTWWLLAHDPGQLPATTVDEHGQRLPSAKQDDLQVGFAEGVRLPILVETLVLLPEPARPFIERMVGLYVNRQPSCEGAPSCTLMLDTDGLTGEVRVDCGVAPSSITLHRTASGSVDDAPYRVIDCNTSNAGVTFHGGSEAPLLLVHFDDVPDVASIDDASGAFSTVLKIEQRNPGPLTRSSGANWAMNVPTASTGTSDLYRPVGDLKFFGSPQSLWTTLLVNSERSNIDVRTPEVLRYEAPTHERASLLGSLDSIDNRVMHYVDTSVARRWHIYDQISLISLAIGASGLVALPSLRRRV
jgi:hypothetical protein